MDLHRVKGFMLDMDGTFYLGDHLLPGALAFLDLLNQKGLASIRTSHPIMAIVLDSSKIFSGVIKKFYDA